jgi:trk system potassium uptake protein TrkH
MNESPTPEKTERPRSQGLVARTAPVHRPLVKVVQLGRSVAKPPKALGVGGVVIGFLIVIFLGAILLSLPIARVPGTEWSFLTALFTSVSAVCVTGLEVTDTGVYWSTFGHAVILGLVQAGGIGVMTSSMLILILLGRPISLRDRFLVREMAGIVPVRSVGGLVVVIIIATVILELAGGAFFWYRLHERYDSTQPIWQAAFHSISAFNNAGFEIFQEGSSLTTFAHDPLFLIVTAVLIIFGGFGMLLLMDLISKRRWRALTLSTRLVLLASVALLLFGFVSIFVFEYNNPATLGGMTIQDKATNAFFHSADTRTAGFTSISMTESNEETQFAKIALMYIGGATGSTAGGIKITTFVVLVLATFVAIRGYEHISIFGRRIGHRIVYRALSVAALFALVIFVATFILIITEPFQFRQVLFEVVSALSNVGLTLGITPDLSVAGKITIAVLMFIGRLGPLTLAYTLAQRSRERMYEAPEGDVAIG